MFLCLFFGFSLASTFVLLNYVVVVVVVVVVVFPLALALPILLLRVILLLLLLAIFPVSSFPLHVDGQNLDQTFTKRICS